MTQGVGKPGGTPASPPPFEATELVARIQAQLRKRAAMANELEAERQHRRRLAALLPELPRDAVLYRRVAGGG